MSAIQPNLLATAKQGDPKAIAALMNQSLKAKGVTAKAFIQNRRLNIMLESAEVPPQTALMAFTRKGIESLSLQTIRLVRVHGRQEGNDLPAWAEEFEIATYVPPVADATQDTIIIPATTVHPLQESGQSSARPRPQVTKLALSKSAPSIPWLPLSIGAAAVALLGFGGSVFWLRSTQTQAMNQAQTLIASTGHPASSGDITALRNDQNQLQQALTLLEDAPHMPLLGMGTLLTQRETVQAQLTAVNTDIAAYEALLPEIQAVIDQFSALDSGLDVGMNYRDYGGEVRQLKASLDRLGRMPGAKDLQVYEDIEAAYRHYEFAHGVWKYYVESSERYSFFPASSSYGRLLVNTYNVETTDIVGTRKIYLNDALSTVWQAASLSLEAAQDKI